jgi:hypothetical protein
MYQIQAASIEGKPFKALDGTYYDPDTPDQVVKILEAARRSALRLRLFYGDPATGKAEPQKLDVLGTISRTNAPYRRAKLVANATAAGGGDGGVIPTASIVAIKGVQGHTWIYRHPGFSVGEITVGKSDFATTEAAVYVDGRVHTRGARASMERLAAFLKGERMSR